VTIIDFPIAGVTHTGVTGVNNAGTIVGWYLFAAEGIGHGFAASSH
jgi:hypothetical protein